MFRAIFVSISLVILLATSLIWSQEKKEEAKIELSKKTFGINLGTGFFQQVKLNLVNFDQEILATSENLIPVNFKANFNYYFTPNLAIRFSSGYGIYQQRMTTELDYAKIHTKDTIEQLEATFSVSGFPAEAALIFQTPVDARATMFFHFGLGLGYYAYNYEAEGTLKAIEVKTNQPVLREEYLNPSISLAGGAQFFILGFDLNITPRIVATLEISKAGWSTMKLTRDVVTQEIEAGEVTYETKYGYVRQDYSIKSGLDDMAISLGVFWQL